MPLDPPPHQRIGAIAPNRPLRTEPLAFDQVNRLLSDPGWCVQELLPGQRILLRNTQDGVIAGVATDGSAVAVPERLRAALGRSDVEWLIDGMLLGDCFTAFDLPRLEGTNFGSVAYRLRLAGLRTVFAPVCPHIAIAETVIDRPAKESLVLRLRAAGKPGIILKKLAGIYPCGCPAGADRWLHCRFTSTWPAQIGQR